MTTHTHTGPNNRVVTHNHSNGEWAHMHGSLQPLERWTWGPVPEYVVTFDSRPVYGPGAIEGLQRMPLADAYGVLSEAGRIPKRGRIVNARTLETVED
jgi:hypothetical protein